MSLLQKVQTYWNRGDTYRIPEVKMIPSNLNRCRFEILEIINRLERAHLFRSRIASSVGVGGGRGSWDVVVASQRGRIRTIGSEADPAFSMIGTSNPGRTGGGRGWVRVSNTSPSNSRNLCTMVSICTPGKYARCTLTSSSTNENDERSLGEMPGISPRSSSASSGSSFVKSRTDCKYPCVEKAAGCRRCAL
jgi:hypothetical protein